MKNPDTIRRHIRRLRKLIDKTKDPVVSRIAFAMEQSLIWVITSDAHWGGLDKEAEENAGFLKKELEKMFEEQQEHREKILSELQTLKWK